MQFKLLTSPTTPYGRKVQIVMIEKKIDCKVENVDVWAADSTVPQINPLGKIPCLIMEDGGAVFDSRVIVEYLDTLTPVSKLIPAAGRERLEVRTWEALADGLLDAALLARLEQTWPGREATQRSQAWVNRQLGKIQTALVAMGEGLGNREWCAGINYSLADIAVGVALNYLDFRFPAIDWRGDHPNLVKLLEKLNARQSFIDTAPSA